MFGYGDLYGPNAATANMTNPDGPEVMAYAQQGDTKVANITAGDKKSIFGGLVLLVCLAVVFHVI